MSFKDKAVLTFTELHIFLISIKRYRRGM